MYGYSERNGQPTDAALSGSLAFLEEGTSNYDALAGAGDGYGIIDHIYYV